MNSIWTEPLNFWLSLYSLSSRARDLIPNDDFNDLLDDIDKYQSIISSNGNFFLYNRVVFLLREYERINKIYFSGFYFN